MRKTGFFKNCERCTTAFWCYQYNKARRYCSTACSNKNNAVNQSKTKRLNAKQNLSSDKKWRYNILYIEWRNKCLTRDKFTCQNCGVGLTLRTAVVHHYKSWRNYPELRYDLDNGMTVCRKCHNIVDENLGRGRYGYK